MILKTFGKLPAGEALKKIEASSNYRDKNFQNIALTKVFTGDESQMKIVWKFKVKWKKHQTGQIASFYKN